MKLLQFEISGSLATRLEAEADRSGRSVDQIVLEALETAVPILAQPADTSFADLADDVIGSAEGPEDLSSNPDKMEGYGK